MEEQEPEETSVAGQVESSSSDTSTHTDENEELMITSTKLIRLQFADSINNNVGIRAADVALGLRGIPAGFYAVIHYSGLEWRTENKPSSVSHDVVEWTGPIPMLDPLSLAMDCPDPLRSPSVLSAAVRLEVYASFELQPMLGSGEQLRKITITVGQLLDRSATGVRECQQVLPMDFGLIHRDSVRFSPEGWGRYIAMFIHFSDCHTAKVQEW